MHNGVIRCGYQRDLTLLSELLTLDIKGEYATQVKYLDGEAMGRQVFLSSRRFFERVAQNQPLVLMFEDFHWADESSTLLLDHLMRNLLEIENLPPRVGEMIVQKSEGNPFFLEEIMRSLIDRRGVEHDPSTGQWRATSFIETITIPDTIQGVIMAGVDRLDEELKQVLRSASVIGRSFLYRVLRVIAQAVQDMDRYLDNLQAIELIREKRKIPEFGLDSIFITYALLDRIMAVARPYVRFATATVAGITYRILLIRSTTTPAIWSFFLSSPTKSISG